jgi:hypothetical protein
MRANAPRLCIGRTVKRDRTPNLPLPSGLFDVPRTQSRPLLEFSQIAAFETQNSFP